jgi:hypothetical protein
LDGIPITEQNLKRQLLEIFRKELKWVDYGVQMDFEGEDGAGDTTWDFETNSDKLKSICFVLQLGRDWYTIIEVNVSIRHYQV